MCLISSLFLRLKWIKCAWTCIWMHGMDVFGCFWYCMRGTVARADILTQASTSRLGENNRSSPWFYSSFSPRRPTLVFERCTSRLGEPLRKQVVPLLEPSFKRGTSLFLGEGRSRPGEWGSLRRELTEWPLYQCLTSRLGENA